MKIYASMCSGFGGADIGAIQAGLAPKWGIELDPDIAAVANANLGHHVKVADLLACDPRDFERVDVLHASPPCPAFSVANANRGEKAQDLALARKVAEFVTVLQPQVFTLENVWGYRNSESWKLIEDALWGAGYWLHVEHVNAADYGVPQSRKRMIVRAVRGGWVPALPAPVPWVGWYASIEDLLDTLPDTQFADWQLARLPEELATALVGQGGYEGRIVTVDRHDPACTVTANHNQLGIRAFLMQVQGEGGDGIRDTDEPAPTVTTTHAAAKYRAWLVDSTNARTNGNMTIRDECEPAMTVTTGGPKHPQRALLQQGRVVSMTPRCLARFQSFPDWYELSGNRTLDARGIGNATPPQLYCRILEGLL